MPHPSAILIAGPTASGKSGLAMALAERFAGTVINADSMQVYAELRILTARPSESEMARVPHRLYGHAQGASGYSVGRYVADAAGAIAATRAAGRLPIFVGGTGLYFKALIEGLSPIPPIPDDIRRHWRDRAATEGAARLHAVLAERDAQMAARLEPTDPQRLVRALEVLDATGRSLGEWQREPGVPVMRGDDCVRLVLSPERSELHRRCDTRFDQMISAGALEEVRALAELRLDPSLPIMRALGVRPLLAHLAGAMSLEAAITASKAETRQYAKRQVTWLNGHMMSWRWLSAQDLESHDHFLYPFIDFER